MEPGRAQASAPPLEEHLHARGARLHQQRDRATRGRRQSRPPGEGPPRPLGLPAVADPLRPRAGARLLEASDAQDCLRGREGSRPQVGALDAVATRTLTLPGGREAWVVAADSPQCLAPIEPDGMVRLCAARLAAGALLRRIRQWLQAGGLDTDGPGRPPVTGSPHGGTVSPGLAKVCRPDVRAGWGANVVQRPGRGAACLRRYADAWVGACADQAEAARIYTGLGQRRAQCGRARSGAQTRGIPCPRPRLAGQTRCACLGCACRWGKGRTGHDPRKRRTARQQRRSALRRCPAGCKAQRHRRRAGRCTRRHATLRGSAKDSGVPGNAASRPPCCNRALQSVLQWRNRRRHRHR